MRLKFWLKLAVCLLYVAGALAIWQLGDRSLTSAAKETASAPSHPVAEKTAPVASTLTNSVFNRPTNSSPIALSADNRLVWVVNSDDDSVSVIRTDLNTVIAKIGVGDEPQGVRAGSANRYAYVANAAANSVTVIRITNSDPNNFTAAVDTTVGQNGQLTTGAEPWNIVTSLTASASLSPTAGRHHHGHRRRPEKVIGHVNLRKQRVQRPGPRAPFPAPRTSGDPGQFPALCDPLPVFHQAPAATSRR